MRYWRNCCSNLLRVNHLDMVFTGYLKDSLLLTAGIYPALQQLAADSIHTGSIANIANELIDSGFIKPGKVKRS